MRERLTTQWKGLFFSFLFTSKDVWGIQNKGIQFGVEFWELHFHSPLLLDILFFCLFFHDQFICEINLLVQFWIMLPSLLPSLDFLVLCLHQSGSMVKHWGHSSSSAQFPFTPAFKHNQVMVAGCGIKPLLFPS